MRLKKVMLYLSLIMAVVYATAVCLVIVLQEPIRNAQGLNGEGEFPFIIPVPMLIICIVMTAAVVIFNILLMRAAEDMRSNMETAAMIVLSVFIVLMSWIFNLGILIQLPYYMYSVGAMGVAAYNVLQQGITACNPVLVFSMLLQVVHAGISLGRKGR